MKHALLSCFLLLTTAAAAQSSRLDLGHVDSLRSQVLHEKRGLWVYVPPADPSGVFAPKRYPVLYLLDGDLHFASVMGLVQQLSAVNGNALCPEMIIVGIPHPFPTRTRDLTPTHATKRWDNQPDRTLATSGGGEPFLAFLEKEVVPYIDTQYPTAPYRLLVGHSLGGLAVLNALATKPALFNAYVALEPSVWWDQRVVLPKLEAAFQQGHIKDRKLFLAVAHTLPAGRDTTGIRRDTSASTEHLRAEMAGVDLLRRQSPAALAWTWKYYPDESHGSVPLRATDDALRAFFRHDEAPLSTSVADPTFSADALRQQYRTRSQQYGYPVLPPEELVNLYAWGCLQKQQPAKAFDLFRLNLANYPASFNAHTSMGAYYEQQGKLRKALPYYVQALQLRDDPETRQKVKELQALKSK
ncbi:alpha/beta hydrolase-fold protein [Hymenobacter lapidiphilus]|uniref:Alpha/beta hydrolase n=1 Tax=Hymenobacter lapidiphilus TaxID=2608003 RepID=A0A7Y7U6F8_9BACT|nr:alpha/beta hydrolase-fold protein [Hymenobacter lapidiphilus]NVO32352.1 alpha/beta hydrolase [Hymenobacter lapidiphilus]